MNIYLVGPVKHTWDEYDSFVVVAKDEADARHLASLEGGQDRFLTAPVTLIGTADPSFESRIVLGSFNAG